MLGVPRAREGLARLRDLLSAHANPASRVHRDRAIAFTHEYDGQPPRGAGLRRLLVKRVVQGVTHLSETAREQFATFFGKSVRKPEGVAGGGGRRVRGYEQATGDGINLQSHAPTPLHAATQATTSTTPTAPLFGRPHWLLLPLRLGWRPAGVSRRRSQPPHGFVAPVPGRWLRACVTNAGNPHQGVGPRQG
jgi:hypothetical protein